MSAHLASYLGINASHYQSTVCGIILLTQNEGVSQFLSTFPYNHKFRSAFNISIDSY